MLAIMLILYMKTMLGNFIFFSGQTETLFYFWRSSRKSYFVIEKLYSVSRRWIYVIGHFKKDASWTNFHLFSFPFFFSELSAFYIDNSFVWCILQLVFSLLLPCLIFSELGRSVTLEKMMQWYGFYPKVEPFNLLLAELLQCMPCHVWALLS